MRVYQTAESSGSAAEPQKRDLSAFIGKKLACIGDSVTYGVGVKAPDTNYVENLEIALQTTAINLGISGTALCDRGARSCQFKKLQKAVEQAADIITIYLGVNDWAAGGNWGDPRGDYYALGTPDTGDTSTFYGAMKMWCDAITALKATEPCRDTLFVFITPHFTSWWNENALNNSWDPEKRNFHGYTQAEMSTAIKAVCKDYGIPVVDMYDFTLKLYQQDPEKYETAYAGDGIHPTAACHKLMADYILQCLAAI